MEINVELVESEFKLLNNANNKDLAFNEIFENINRQTELLLAKKHLFAIISIAGIIDKLMIDSGVKDEDIESIMFSENEYRNDNYALSISIEPTVTANANIVYALEADINDQMYILGEPKFFFFSDKASDQIDDFEHFSIEGKVGEYGSSFIKMALNEELLNLYETVSFKTSLENNLPGKEIKATKKNKM